MTNNVLITLSCGTDNPNRATRALFLAAVAQKKGKNVTVFLLDDGVYLARKGVTENLKAATGDSADDSFAHLQAHEVPILVCTPCAKSRFIEEKDLADSCRMATAAELIDLACDSATISL
ncbi:MAG: DsrE family protein [Proteobacteria bacterium]|nr:DsrE family protein [Pseudomonadota bacterium]MBU1583677.1 DsrE family protein [Pseudomonadota bacterium]MBU2630671.1 DsrE family protein [Pseudomonadota bacterium]